MDYVEGRKSCPYRDSNFDPSVIPAELSWLVREGRVIWAKVCKCILEHTADGVGIM
jgi:hypothetical protein